MSKKMRLFMILWVLFWALLANVALAATPPPAVPPPVEVTRTATWQDNSNNETGFTFQACSDICTSTAAGWKEIGKLAPNVTTFTFKALAGSTTSYRVGATSAAPTTFSAIVPDVLPPAPTTPPTAPTFTLPPCKTLIETAPGSKLYQCGS